MEYDIIIPVAKRDLGFLPRVLEYVRRYLVDAVDIYIIANESCGERLKKKEFVRYGVTFLNEDAIIDNLSYERIRELLLERDVHIRTGWYLQQFLKIAFAKSPYAKKYYLSWDSDTLPLSKICFFNEGKPLFTKKKEFNDAYFNTIKKLLGLEKIVDYSFIAEHMLFDRDTMNELIERIEESKVNGEDWIEKILNACENLEKPCFSEFETYGTYVMTYYPGKYETQVLNTFRSAGLIKGRCVDDRTLSRLAFDLDIASFELFDKPPFPYSISYYKYLWSRRWSQIRLRSITSMLGFLKNKIKEKRTK